jgi:hypothetical protein
MIFHRKHVACLPPSTLRETPVEKDAKSLAKNVIAFASSSTVPVEFFGLKIN